MPEKTRREEVVSSFKKYCSVCKGRCCSNGELNLFGWERERLALKKTVYEDKCVYCRSRGCELDLDRKPIDCISYPVYPVVARGMDGDMELTGLMVHRSCPFSEEIAGDSAIVRVMKSFWEAELASIREKDLSGWLSDEDNYWSDENVIRAALP